MHAEQEVQKPFAQANELVGKEKRLAQLNLELNNKEKNSEAELLEQKDLPMNPLTIG